ncbi:hypothetical protein D5H78_13270 [Vallicoccus soli]|uniref:Asp23/Gls24 family envelope stress response protein n=1 Tax=Vallicoccus soli TaxID=2339232 RepID=A0A3A3YY85_9ACTN|nr:hypothetical protein D5H78_13270 [Vallicoccus soli]
MRPARQERSAASGPDVRAVAAAVVAAPGVAALGGGGTAALVATHLPGERVRGVRVGPDGGLQVAVVLRYGDPVPSLVDGVRAAAASAAPGRAVDVLVADVLLPGEEPPALPAGAGA